jgi:hypothetical protein
MGLSSSKSTTKPVYNKQIESAGNTLTSAYNTAAPRIQGVSDQLSGLVPEIVSRFRAGDPGVTAARDYNVDVLSGRYLGEGNPYLEQVIANAGNDVRNQSQATLGLKGLTGGSSYADIISRTVGTLATNLRYQDYDAERNRMSGAAAMAPGISAAEYIPLQAALSVGETAQDPLRAAVGYSSGLGGLLGQYTQTKSKQALGPLIASMLSNIGSAYAMGG